MVTTDDNCVTTRGMLSGMLRRSVIVLGVATALVLTASACNSKPKAKPAPTPEVAVALSDGTIASPGPAPTVSDAARAAVRQTLARYIAAATVQPFITGQVGPGIDEIFDQAAGADALTGTGRAALVDDGLGRGTPQVQPVTATINGIADSNGAIAVLATTLTIGASAQTKDGPVTITREATFVFRPDTWRIYAYDVRTTRTTPEGQTTTSSTSR
ncbi:MAG: hypothetical protein ACOYN3_08895 [Acidimicrobiia bacterium]